jgi:gamma-glutamyltranspeptidase/glutathione hydrolase
VTFDFNSRRSPVIARNGMVAASQPLAAIAGLRILMQGGNAADAVIATAAALNVTEPTSTGIGGDCFALFYDANTRAVTALNGSGRAPAALTIDLIKRQGLASIEKRQSQIANPYHAHTITVPGACAGWFDLIARHGTMPMRDILAPAIELAEKGFPVAPTTERLLAAFQNITLTVIHESDRVRKHLTPLSTLQQRILQLLGLSPVIYTDFALDSS